MCPIRSEQNGRGSRLRIRVLRRRPQTAASGVPDRTNGLCGDAECLSFARCPAAILFESASEGPRPWVGNRLSSRRLLRGISI